MSVFFGSCPCFSHIWSSKRVFNWPEEGSIPVLYIMGEEEISPQNNSSEVTRKSRSVYWGSKINSKCPPRTVTWKAGCQHPEPGMSLPPLQDVWLAEGGQVEESTTMPSLNACWAPCPQLLLLFTPSCGIISNPCFLMTQHPPAINWQGRSLPTPQVAAWPCPAPFSATSCVHNFPARLQMPILVCENFHGLLLCHPS